MNSVHPTGVATPMIQNEMMDDQPSLAAIFANLLPVGVIEPEDVTEAMVYLCGKSGRYVTGVTLPVDAGILLK